MNAGGLTSTESFLIEFFPGVYARMKEEEGRISNYCKFDSQLLTLFTSSLYLAGLFICPIVSHVTNKLGRRASMCAGGAFFFAGAAAGGVALNVHMLIFSRFLMGVGLGFTNQSVPLYISEMAPARHRGAIFNLFDICVSAGILVANLVNYFTQKIDGGWGWRISIALPALPASILAAGAIFIPETPPSIIQRGGDLQEASCVLQRIRGCAEVSEELNRIVAAAGGGGIPLFLQVACSMKLPAVFCDGPRVPRLPATDRHKPGELLRSSDVPHHGAQGKRLPDVHNGDEDRRHSLLSGGHGDGRQAREASPVLCRRASNVYLAGDRRGNHGGGAWRQRDDGKGMHELDAGLPLFLRFWVWVFMGSSSSAGDKRDLPAGDEIEGAEHRGGGGFLLQLRDGGEPAVDALFYEMGDLLLFRGMGVADDSVCVSFLAGDQGNTVGGDEEGVG
ncbi:Hexose carrier protein HEX6 [Apostasia shenzhenica]|uniref:Hexose carrier protein HEX6 n=1 Tax=Apostasia shenzhenica TaxID=1088818 RepID=A0A2H9ZT30_9ASPA|nr:Hexose carrier protein HEX6 [Apostasia shenzhenica]